MKIDIGYKCPVCDARKFYTYSDLEDEDSINDTEKCKCGVKISIDIELFVERPVKKECNEPEEYVSKDPNQLNLL